MLRLLIAQILKSRHDLIAFVYEELVTTGNGPTLQRLRTLFRISISSLGPVYLVVDGLDECDSAEQNRALKEILALPAGDACEPYRLKVLICSRETKAIPRLLRQTPYISLTDEQASVSRDIAAYTKASLEDLRTEYDDALINQLEQQVISKAEGIQPVNIAACNWPEPSRYVPMGTTCYRNGVRSKQYSRNQERCREYACWSGRDVCRNHPPSPFSNLS